jgi:hypothetical protein
MSRSGWWIGAALLWAAEAQALDPYMWGIGPRVGTNAIPGRYPLRFPKEIRDPASGSTLERVRTDVFFGVDSVYYANGHSRVGAFAGMGLGAQYLDAHLQLEYDYVITAGALDFLVGGGLGFGTTTFRGESFERLTVPYYPLRVESSLLIRDEGRGYQLTAFGQYNLPSNHFYQDLNGFDVDVRGGTYVTLGVELSVMFGDFSPPRPRRRGASEEDEA